MFYKTYTNSWFQRRGRKKEERRGEKETRRGSKEEERDSKSVSFSHFFLTKPYNFYIYIFIIYYREDDDEDLESAFEDMLGDILDDKPSKSSKTSKPEEDEISADKSSDDFEKEFMSVLNDITCIFNLLRFMYRLLFIIIIF